MSLVVDDIVVCPKEAVPGGVESSLSKNGLEIIGADFGEAKAKGTAVQTDKGIVLVSREPETRIVTLKLRVRPDSETTLPQAAHYLQTIVGALQSRDEWFRRDHFVGGDFGPNLFHVTGEVGFADFAGWQVGACPDVTLTMVCDFAAYSTEEREQGPFVSTPGDRHLIFTEVPSPGTTKGLWRGRITNEGAEDWRALILSRECEYAPTDLEDPTAQPHYLATDLTMKGGSKLATGPSAPEVRAVGTISSGATAVSPGLPAGTERGDLLVMVAESGGATTGAEASTPLTAEGWSSPPAPYADQKKGNTRLTLLYRIATGSDPTTTNDTGDHQIAKIIGIKSGTFDPHQPFNTAAVGAQALTKSVSIPGGTTTLDNCLILVCASGNLPDALGTAEFGAATNASLTSLTERIDNTTFSGDGGAIYAATGVKATAGAYSATTLTAVTEAERGVASIAINAPVYVEHNALTAGWLTILESKITGVGHMTHQGPRVIWMRIEDPGEEAGGVQLKLLARSLGASRWDESLPIIETPVVDGWIPVNLGVARPEAAVVGEDRFEFKLQARAPAGSGAIRIRDVYPLSTEQYMVLSESYDPPAADGATTATPATIADDSTLSGRSWVNPTNVKVSDNVYAEVGAFLSAGEGSHYLKATGFGFAIPAESLVLGIAVAIEKRGVGGFKDRAVRIVKAGTIKETDRSKATPWPTADERVEHGGEADLWGETWTAADINDAGFGCALAAVCLASTETGKVDRITITVYYAERQNQDRVCFASRAVEPTSGGTSRQHPTEDIWGLLVPDGFAPTVEAGGPEGRPARTLLLPSAGDLKESADGLAPPALQAATYSRDGYHSAREAT